MPSRAAVAKRENPRVFAGKSPAAMAIDDRTTEHFAAEHFAACMLGDEGREGIAAFIEKRKPTWSV